MPKDDMKNKRRSSNIELLRIISMLAVIACHWAAHGAWGDGLTEINRNLIRILPRGGNIAINVFVLITGYFGISTTRDVKGKIFKLWIDRWFYSIIISVLMLVLGLQTFSINYILRAVFPVVTCRHNYITTFIFLYFFIPYLNVLLKNLSRKTMEKLLVLSTIVFSILPSLMELTGLWTNNVYSYLLWMMYIYSIGAYLQLTNDWKRLPWRLICFFMMVIMAVIAICIEPNGVLLSGFASKIYNFILVMVSISVFACFATLEIPNNKVINGLASSSFAVLLIHDDPLMRSVLWTKIFKNAEYASSSNLWVHVITCVLITYIGCVAVDKIYTYVLKRPIQKIIISWKNNRS